ncbi:hypothetical protein [Mesorhizobium sp. LSHC414A00]|uniref:hypothetical protein n=1 Tax=Mesorhizobium sp. LSHC414A00 TaxID=1287287 RepID=UPI0003CF80C4|nr:hypothetical protein [Mesorhizobium sp. LSHC414A00]ESX78472.1 hypothetical protein X757_08860 [Mesorhizobium sp. LSHC414A00]
MTDNSQLPKWHHRHEPTKNWDSIARCYVEHDTLPQETFAVWPMTREAMNRVPRYPEGGMVGSPVAANDNDRGPYITTFTGRFYMFDPRPEDWCVADVAHGLSNICRYTGAGTYRYSVAEHSVHIYRHLTAQALAPAVRLAGLMHDAPESLSGFGDVASPAKKRAPIIKSTEENIWRKAIAPVLGLDAELPEAVHIADNRICADEMSQNLHEVDPKVGPPLGIVLEYWEPARAEAEFLRAFTQVQNMRVAA